MLHAAYMMDTVGNKAAKQAIAEIKVAVPNMTLRVSTAPCSCTAAAA